GGWCPRTRTTETAQTATSDANSAIRRKEKQSATRRRQLVLSSRSDLRNRVARIRPVRKRVHPSRAQRGPRRTNRFHRGRARRFRKHGELKSARPKARLAD